MNDTDTIAPEAVEAAEAAMVERGERTTERVQDDYFAFDETHRVMLPDGISYVEHRTFSEGARRKYLNGINRDVTIQRATGDAKMRMQPGDERYSLLKSAICGWNLTRNGNPMTFNSQNLEMFLSSAPPKIVDLIDKEVRKTNAWLLEDMSAEDIRKEIEELQELLAKKEEEEAGK